MVLIFLNNSHGENVLLGMNYLEDRKRILQCLAWSGVIIAVLWGIHFLTWVLDIDRTLFATTPKETSGLVGILTSPLMHADFWHLLGNSGPLFVFAASMIYFYRKSALKATIGIWLATGISVWIIGNRIPIIGASGVVYGLGSYLFFSGVFRRDVRSIVIALVIAFYYGGSLVAGVFPTKEGVSWESHLFGAIAGVAMAWHYRRVDVQPRKRYRWQDEPDEDANDSNAVWNYRQNWPGANTLYIPGDEERGIRSSENP
jgi:membrane associated rhomboid family serine protease